MRSWFPAAIPEWVTGVEQDWESQSGLEGPGQLLGIHVSYNGQTVGSQGRTGLPSLKAEPRQTDNSWGGTQQTAPCPQRMEGDRKQTTGSCIARKGLKNNSSLSPSVTTQQSGLRDQSLGKQLYLTSQPVAYSVR